MAANPDVRSVFEFLRRNGFVEAETALRDDIFHGGGIAGPSLASSSSSDRLSEFPRLPTPPPPVRIVVGRGRQWRQGASGDEGEECSSTSDSSSAFVSMVSSPSDLVNPFGRWSATDKNGSEDDSSDSLSQFGTAREYNDAEILNDSLWANDRRGVQLRQPSFGTADDSGCLSEDKYVMTVGAEENYMRDMSGLDLVSGGFNSATSINCLDDVGHPFSSLDTARDTGKDPLHPRVLDAVTPICNCCSEVKESYGLESEGYYSWCNEEIKEPHIPLYGSCYELMSDEPNSLQSTQLDKFQPKLVDNCPSVSLEQNVNFCSENDVNSSRPSSRNKEDLVCSSPEKELQMLNSMVASRSSSTNGSSSSNYKSNWRRSKVQKDEVKDTVHDSSMQFHNAEKACMPDVNCEYQSGGDREMIGGSGNRTNRDPEENGTDSDVHMLENQDEEYEIFDLRIIHRKNRTGFEENKDFPIVLNTIIAGRYYVSEYLGSAAFSKVIQAHDLQTGMDVCLKIIKNDKDFFDQSLDEIKLLKFVNKYDPADERHILRLFDYFYHQSITQQCLEALEYLHYLGIIHCDLKPENILIKSYSRCLIKVIDLGSSCFQTDNLCSYVQSRSYRAPEVILGLPYDQKIDIWSLGCILAELFSGDVLFPNDSLAVLLARMVGMFGPIDVEMLERGQETHKYFTSDYDIYYRNEDTDQVEYIIPEKTSLEERLDGCDAEFIEFVRELLQINPEKRPTATEALEHPWLSHPY